MKTLLLNAFSITIILGLLSNIILAYPHHNDDTDEFYIGFPEDDISINRGRIISGQDAEPHSAPYIVSIREGENGAHICGGSILTKNTILTAAHCLKSNLYIAVGLHDRRDVSSAQVIKVKNYIGHDNYKGGSTPYDIGVLHLSEPIQFNDNIKPIDLPTTNEKQTGEVTLYGWGRTIANSWNLPNILQVVKTDLLTNDECLKELPDKDKKNLHQTMICTGSRMKNISSCNADSGGPLVQKHAENNKTLLVGLVSWGVLPCGKANKPSVYTHIGSHLDWIKINTRK